MIREGLRKILPSALLDPLFNRLNFDKIQEIRLRAERFAMVNYGGKDFFLTNSGISSEDKQGLFVSTKMIHDIIVRCSEYSLYAVNDKLSAGFITIEWGIRVGIAGEVVLERGEVRTIKNFSSLNIRVPHEVKGCGDRILKDLFTREIKSTLIISPPGAGKTTLLRDIARQLSKRVSVLVVDERSEIASQHKGVMQLDVGARTDVFSGSDKEFAFTAGIRALAPSVIITDELATEKDVFCVEKALSSGVAVIASVHAKTIEDVKNKKAFKNILEQKGFSNFVVLSKFPAVGSIKKIECL